MDWRELLDKPKKVISQLLRSSTAESHQNLERKLNLFERVQSLDLYVELLRRFYGFFAAFEQAVEARPEWRELNFPFEPRKKIALLRQDLLALGDSPESIRELPWVSDQAFRVLPALNTFGEVLGCLYVLEGSTLGGQIITKHFEKSLGLTPQNGLAFYAGYGDLTGVMWRSFGAFLQSYVDRTPTETRDLFCAEVVQSARACFDSIGDWLCEERRA